MEYDCVYMKILKKKDKTTKNTLYKKTLKTYVN